MGGFLTETMIYAGAALMVWNIYSYIQFSRNIRQSGSWETERTVLVIPTLLLILFLLGYLGVAFFGKPDLLVAGILFGGSIFVAVNHWLMRRIAGRIRINEKLEADLQAAEKASTAKTFFLSNMSHDIRTPLNAILGYTTLARRESTTPEQAQDFLAKIDASGRQLLTIVDDVLEMSRIESGRIELEPEPADIEVCVREAYDLIEAQMKEKGIDFRLECREVRDRQVMCDRNRLNRALMNILSNACKFTPAGGRVEMSLTQPEDHIYEIRVKDNGIGMSKEFAANIFTPFERERTSSVSRIQGTGLGMSITKSIIDMMEGTIEVETEQGKGTEFILRLPLKPVQTEDADRRAMGNASAEGMPACATEDKTASGAAMTPGTARNEKLLEGQRILLVEDNPVNREIACMILEETGCMLETAENGQEALDRILEAPAHSFDLILMDIQMPVMDGYEAAGWIRALKDPDRAGIPIIAMTANAFKEDEEAAIAAGMQGHIAKPLDVNKMMRTIAEVLGI